MSQLPHSGSLPVNRVTGDSCVAVFDRAIGRLALLRVLPLARSARSAEFLQALDDYDIVLTNA